MIGTDVKCSECGSENYSVDFDEEFDEVEIDLDLCGDDQELD